MSCQAPLLAVPVVEALPVCGKRKRRANRRPMGCAYYDDDMKLQFELIWDRPSEHDMKVKFID